MHALPEVLQHQATGLILVHNHPSVDPAPSKAAKAQA
ncbi:JAB domain-containing protein [Pseudomonas cichorii]|nr:hypothetical protein [Pseudomonas cichorii]